MKDIRFFNGEWFPLEMHKTKIVQKLQLVPVRRRLEAIGEAGYNTFLLKNADIFLDMLTDSGVNAMSDRQQAAMALADDSYAGSATFTRLKNACEKVFGTRYFLPRSSRTGMRKHSDPTFGSAWQCGTYQLPLYYD